jgi:hypothetical protein
MPGVFPFWRIVLDAAVAFVVSFTTLVILRCQFKNSLAEAALMAGTAGLSVLIWRSFANMPTLNNDPIPPISPNDTLSPVIAYVALGMTAAFFRPQDERRWARARVVLALLVFVVNVVTV